MTGIYNSLGFDPFHELTAKCNGCHRECEQVYIVQEKRKERLSFCSEVCYRLFIQKLLSEKDGPKLILKKKRFKIMKNERNLSPVPLAPKNTPENPPPDFKDKT